MTDKIPKSSIFYRRPILMTFLGLVFGWFFYGLIIIPYVPSRVVDFMAQQCEEKGGRIIGDWPIVADGYLLTTKRSGIDSRNPYREGVLTEKKFSFVEYSVEALGNYVRHSKPYRLKPTDKSGGLVTIESPFVRVTLESIESGLCGDFQWEHPFYSNLKTLPEGKCMALVEINDESELWSRYEFRDEWVTEDNKIQPIDWKVWSVIDRQENKEVVVWREFLMCLSEWTPNAPTGGAGGCRTSLFGTPTLFLCPDLHTRQSKSYGPQKLNFIHNAIISTSQSSMEKNNER